MAAWPQINDSRGWFIRGMRDGFPIFLGYLAVSFSLGIICRNTGLSASMAALMSASNLTSAGEFAAVSLMAAGAPLWDMAATTFVINSRYVLMSASISQKLPAGTPLWKRLVVGFGVTDEIFGLSAGVPGPLSPFYPMGMMSVAIPGWTLGTWLGVVVGNILPASIVTALSVALYGMFLAVIIPPARNDRRLLALITGSMAASWAATKLVDPAFWSAGTRICVLTVAISALAAFLAPVKDEEGGEDGQHS